MQYIVQQLLHTQHNIQMMAQEGVQALGACLDLCQTVVAILDPISCLSQLGPSHYMGREGRLRDSWK
jgi:hypothetical protein